ncbi:MAG: D-alanyl-D-alanine carboxypeptidase [Acidobacteria bacterium]|nr:D-alanyl-D-alanine carboxypeptidase [Acidobacteriota bacterium]
MKNKGVNISRFIGLAAALTVGFATILGQDSPSSAPPLFQDIQVHSTAAATSPTPDPLVRKTGSSLPTAEAPSAPVYATHAIKSSIPILRTTAIPGNSGVLVESAEGNVVVESGSNVPFNPASNVKIATSFAVLKSFGPDYRFPTSVWTDGSYEEVTGTIHGNLYVSGRDPIFGYEHAVALAGELNRMGIRVVQGDLIVTDNFTMNQLSAARSGQSLFAVLDASKRSASARRVWENFRINSGRASTLSLAPSVTFTGSSYAQPMPSNAKLLFNHESAPMREIVKVMMCYSNNFVSERLGDMLGGPWAVARIVRQHTGANEYEFNIQTASGLGINRVTPNAMMKLLRALHNDLARYRMTFADIMPVAGLDRGTLENRFDTDFSSGSVVGKTGTLGQTDGGVSSLAGEISTRQGKFLFVIFNQRGSVSRFRSFQNNYISIIQGQFGGPIPVGYRPLSLDARIAKTRFSYPAKTAIGSE